MVRSSLLTQINYFTRLVNAVGFSMNYVQQASLAQAVIQSNLQIRLHQQNSLLFSLNDVQG